MSAESNKERRGLTGVNDDDVGAAQKNSKQPTSVDGVLSTGLPKTASRQRADVGAAAHFAEHLASTAGHCTAARKQGGRRVTSHGRGDAGRCSTASAAAHHGELEELLFL
jgi:hypothetical protein